MFQRALLVKKLVVRERERERIGLVVNDLPTVESKAPSQFGGVLLASARHAPLAPDKGYNTHDTLWCTPQPRRSPLSRRCWLCQFFVGLSHSRGVTFMQLVRCFVVRSSSPARGGSGARRMFQLVSVRILLEGGREVLENGIALDPRPR